MFDTPITVVGNVLTAPQWRRTTGTGTFVVTFRVAATSRRYDRARDAWVDGDSLRIRVTCWRRLGENVSVSLQLGDPVIVHGRIFTRDWTDDQGTRHTVYELEATSVGHDLSRGVGKFARRRAAGTSEVTNDATADTMVNGEPTEEVDNPGRPTDLPPDHELFDDFDGALVEPGAVPLAADAVLAAPPDRLETRQAGTTDAPEPSGSARPRGRGRRSAAPAGSTAAPAGSTAAPVAADHTAAGWAADPVAVG